MNEQLILSSDDRVAGDSLFVGLSVSALWNLLVARGLLPKQQALETLDATLFALERRRETWRGPAGIIDQARTRLEALIEQIEAVPT